jgi:hypothetical protein
MDSTLNEDGPGTQFDKNAHKGNAALWAVVTTAAVVTAVAIREHKSVKNAVGDHRCQRDPQRATVMLPAALGFGLMFSVVQLYICRRRRKYKSAGRLIKLARRRIERDQKGGPRHLFDLDHQIEQRLRPKYGLRWAQVWQLFAEVGTIDELKESADDPISFMFGLALPNMATADSTKLKLEDAKREAEKQRGSPLSLMRFLLDRVEAAVEAATNQKEKQQQQFKV